MKLLVFAHTPPPHHGQSYMVKLMLDHFGGDARTPGHRASAVDCYHVDSRYSEDLEDIGSFRLGKAALMLRYCLQAIWCRLRYGVKAFYYVPAPGKRAALYRDWIVMLLCRPFFRDFVHHWHAVGLGDWLQTEAYAIERWLTHRLLGRPTLGLALAISSMRDALWFRSGRVELVQNGIPDPCPDFATTLLPRRHARVAERRDRSNQPLEVTVLYLAHCTESKGLFDAMQGVALANATMAERVRFQLIVAGAFVREDERQRFDALLATEPFAGTVKYAGFVSGEEKSRLLAESDFLCFPTYYEAEGQPVNLIESMAFGLPSIVTAWRSIPDLLPAGYPGLIPTHQPQAVADALQQMLSVDVSEELRARFCAHYTETRHLEALVHALHQAETSHASRS